MLTREELIRGMMDQNVPRWKAEKEADRQLADAARKLEPSPFARMIEHPLPPIPNPITSFGPVDPAMPGFVRSEMDSEWRRPDLPAREWPFRLTLPWSHLVSDNAKYAPAMRGAKPALVLKTEYRSAKRLTALAARAAWGDGTTYTDPLQLHARVYFPQQSRKGDAVNFAKCAHDALQGIVYDSDDQLWDARWTRAGVDVDRPRAEVAINPYPVN